jgi:hypothetical protein
MSRIPITFHSWIYNWNDNNYLMIIRDCGGGWYVPEEYMVGWDDE